MSSDDHGRDGALAETSGGGRTAPAAPVSGVRAVPGSAALAAALGGAAGAQWSVASVVPGAAAAAAPVIGRVRVVRDGVSSTVLLLAAEPAPGTLPLVLDGGAVEYVVVDLSTPTAR